MLVIRYFLHDALRRCARTRVCMTLGTQKGSRQQLGRVVRVIFRSIARGEIAASAPGTRTRRRDAVTRGGGEVCPYRY